MWETITPSQLTAFRFFFKDKANESTSVPVATYGCESWTLRKILKKHGLRHLR